MGAVVGLPLSSLAIILIVLSIIIIGERQYGRDGFSKSFEKTLMIQSRRKTRYYTQRSAAIRYSEREFLRICPTITVYTRIFS